jgi:hypothetical protein
MNFYQAPKPEPRIDKETLDAADKAQDDLFRNDFIKMAIELNNNREVYAFSGISSEAFEGIKIARENYPDLFTPIEKLLDEFRLKGMVIYPTKTKEKGNLFVVPTGSEDVVGDGIRLQDLDLAGITDDTLSKMIGISRKYNKG